MVQVYIGFSLEIEMTTIGVGTSADGAPLYRQAPCVLVHDDSADAVREPVSEVSMSPVRKFEFVDSIERILQADAARVIERARIAVEQKAKAPR